MTAIHGPTLHGVPLAAIPRVVFPRPTWSSAEEVHVFICLADHYEPKWKGAAASVQQDRVDAWVDGYPRSVTGIADSDGRAPQHSFFFPAEEYEPDHLESLSELCRAGFGDVEIHLHHDNDTADNLRETLTNFKETLHNKHGLLRRNADGEIVYSFIHGNWALCNSRRDGRHCGVNEEIRILLETGCNADYTMPCAPADGQTRIVNSIYYATDQPGRAKSHDRGVLARVGATPPADSLRMIQGPLVADLGNRKAGVIPRLENGDLHGHRAPTMARFWNWLKAGVHVGGQDNWVFVKLHTHGAQEKNAAMLLGDPMRNFHRELAAAASERPWLKYHYVTAWEMSELVSQAEAGQRQPQIHLTAA